MNNINTDILVIGGGLSGLMAAIESKDKNNSVTIVSKSKVGKSGNTLISAGNMTSIGYKDSVDMLYKDITKSGKNLCNYKNVKYFCENIGQVIGKLETYGVKFKMKGKKYDLIKAPGHTNYRLYPADSRDKSYHNKGLSLMEPILEKAEQIGVNIINEIAVIKLIKKDDRVVGALAYDKLKKETLLIKAKVVIIAAGGGCNIYSMSNNTRDITGDGYTLAMNVGTILKDMEFVQFFPTMMFEPLRTIIPNHIFSEGALLRNAKKERFMVKQGKTEKTTTRDDMTRAIYYEIKKQNKENNKVFIDCSKIPESVINTKYEHLEECMNKKNLTLKKDLIEVAPVAHFFLGGIEINTSCETNIEGLLACGESAWGLHGANRLPGNALAEAALFGMRAGLTAKEKIEKNNIENPKFNLDKQEYYIKTDEKIKDMKKSIKNLMWENVSIVKNEKKLMKTSNELKKYRSQITGEEKQKFNLAYIEVLNLIDLSVAVTECSLNRKESRGAHYREDYRDTETTYRGNFSYIKSKGKTSIKFNTNK